MSCPYHGAQRASHQGRAPCAAAPTEPRWQRRVAIRNDRAAAARGDPPPASAGRRRPGLRSVAVAVALGAAVSALPLSALAGTGEPRAGAGDRVPVPRTIDRTGSRDVSAAMQAFIDRVPDGSTVVFPADAHFRLDGSGIQLTGRRNLTFRGNGSTLWSRGCSGSDSLFAVSGGTGITVRNFRLVGDNDHAGTVDAYRSGCEHQHGIALYGAADVRIEKVRVRRVHGDCVYVGIGSGRWTRDVVFRDSVCRMTGRQGFTVVAGRDVRVANVRFDEIAINVLDIEPNDGAGGARNIVFTRNNVGSYSRSKRFRGFFLAANGSHDALVAGVRVTRNTVVGSTLDSLVGDEWTGYAGQRNRRDFVVTGNRSNVTADWGPVLTFKHVDGVVVRDNVQAIRSGPLARFVDSTGVAYVP